MRIGIILTGGTSSRMGREKALLRLPGGGRAAAFLAARLATQCRDVAHVGRPLAGLHLRAISDGGEGPLGALAAAVAAYPGRALLICTCDAPFVPERALRFLGGGTASRGLSDAGAPLTFPLGVSAQGAAQIATWFYRGERRARRLHDLRRETLALRPPEARQCRGANTPDAWRTLVADQRTRSTAE